MKKLAFIVPTGIGASIGGYAGDAGKYARLLSEKFTLIVNPNVVNAAGFSAINDNMLYTEGYALDLFFKEKIALKPAKKNKIGVIFDKSIPKDVLNIHINTLNAIEVVYGIETIYEITSQPVGIEFCKTTAGISTGEIKNPQALIDTASSLLEKNCNALAPVCLFDETADDDEYANGVGVDIVGGVEAIISHLLTKEFLLPCAHAPAFESFDIPNVVISPKSASEYITPTFLPCIILGLYNAPQLVLSENDITEDCICLKNIDGIVLPHNSLGCIPALKCSKKNIPIYAIEENSSILNITAEALNLSNVIKIPTYKKLLEII